MSQAVIRHSKTSDIANILPLYQTAISRSISEYSLTQLLNQAHTLCHVIELEKNIIGFIISQYNIDQADMIAVSIDTNQRKNGYGYTLTQHHINVLKAHGVENYFLEVRESNAPAITLYNTTGFEKISVRKDYYKTENGKENAFIFKKQLTTN